MIAFFLGTQPEVSLAELRLLLNKKEVLRSDKVVFFDDISNEEVSKLFFKLGGTVRVAEVIATPRLPIKEEELVSPIVKILETGERKEYVLTLFGVRVDKKYLHRQIKNELKGVKYDGNIRDAQHKPAAAFHVMKRGGFEFTIVNVDDVVYLLKTLHISDPDYWSLVDGDRPGRDMKIGMLPAKLARIMVNITGVTEDQTLWDPFVGQATIAMQAALLGIPVFGTDKSTETIELGIQNMKWLSEKGLVSQESVIFEKQDIEDARARRRVNGMATEPFLGKARFNPFQDIVRAKKQWRSIQTLYHALLKIAARTLKVGDRIVFIKPHYAYFLEGRVREWYNPPLSIPSETWRVPEVIKDLEELVWVQRDSIVGRTLVILERK